MKEMYTKKMLITPEMAERYLQTNPRNRNIKGYKVQKLEDDIKNGDWIVTHQGIAIDSNGKLIDGHHRLTAILKTGISCEMMVTFNAVESEKIDIGASRTDRDSMFMANVIEKSSVEYNRITYPLIGYIIDRSLGANKSKAVSATAKHILYTKLKKYIDPVIEATNASSGKGKTKSAAVLYAMCCALKGGVSKETIKQWHKITATGDFYVEGNEEMTKVGRSSEIRTERDNGQRWDSGGTGSLSKDSTGIGSPGGCGASCPRRPLRLSTAAATRAPTTRPTVVASGRLSKSGIFNPPSL